MGEFTRLSRIMTIRQHICSSDSLIKLLMEFTIERGALVTLIQTLLVLLFFASHQHVYWYHFCPHSFDRSLPQYSLQASCSRQPHEALCKCVL
jgi:hypothetical protein